MAERDSKGLFKKGNKIGAKGRTPILGIARKKMNLNRGEFKHLLDKYLGMKEQVFKSKAKSNNLPIVEKMIMSAMAKAIKEGDINRMGWFIEQLLGKAPKSELEQNLNITFNKLKNVDIDVEIEKEDE